MRLCESVGTSQGVYVCRPFDTQCPSLRPMKPGDTCCVSRGRAPALIRLLSVRDIQYMDPPGYCQFPPGSYTAYDRQ